MRNATKKSQSCDGGKAARSMGALQPGNSLRPSSIMPCKMPEFKVDLRVENPLRGMASDTFVPRRSHPAGWLFVRCGSTGGARPSPAERVLLDLGWGRGGRRLRWRGGRRLRGCSGRSRRRHGGRRGLRRCDRWRSDACRGIRSIVAKRIRLCGVGGLARGLSRRSVRGLRFGCLG